MCFLYGLQRQHALGVQAHLEQERAEHQQRLANDLGPLKEQLQVGIYHFITRLHRLLDSLVVEYWLRVREVKGSIPSQGPRHTKDVMKMIPVVPLYSTEH